MQMGLNHGSRDTASRVNAVPDRGTAPPVHTTMETEPLEPLVLPEGRAAELFNEAWVNLPDELRRVAEVFSRKSGAAEGAVTMTVLQSIAAAIGSKYRLLVGNRNPRSVSANFNVIHCCSECAGNSLFDQISSSWLNQGRNLMSHHHANDLSQLKRDLAKARSLLKNKAGMVGIPAAYELHEQILQLHRVLNPITVVSEVRPEEMIGALRHSFDHHVVSTGGLWDPVQMLLESKTGTAKELFQLLWLSWQDMGLPSGSSVPMEGTLGVAWQSSTRWCRSLVFGKQHEWQRWLPPVLLVRQGGSAQGNAKPDDDEVLAKWVKKLTGFFSSRYVARLPEVWTLSQDAKALHQQFCNAVANLYAKDENGGREQRELFAGLAWRLAIVLNLVDETMGEDAGLIPDISGDVMHRACMIGWWMVHEHRECLELLRQSAGVDDDKDEGPSDGIDIVDMEGLKQAILDRLTAKGAMTRRELCRSFHELPAKYRDKAIYQLLKELKISELPDGRVALV